MKRYCIKCPAGRVEYFDILGENDDEYKIRLTKIYEGSERVKEEPMPRQLFDLCMKTGYIFEMETPQAIVA
ncbi:MAG: hypothetical protein LBG93_07880 [Treponema sp.]|jgi:hypothetical protein|nr:hypothetical protein [Treponema sp.]